MTDQFKDFLVCQTCGRSTIREKHEHWLYEPSRFDLNVFITRCPQHWSEWALRNTTKGRTQDMRVAALLAREQPVPIMPVSLDPFPSRDRDESVTKVGWV